MNTRLRSKSCHTCGGDFSYEVRKGSDRKHCSAACRERHQLALRMERFKGFPKCSTSDCDSPANRKEYGLCEGCYVRLRRTGSVARRSPRYRYTTAAGYIKLLRHTHPLADGKGYVFEHRAAAFEKYGPGTQACYWCGRGIEWNAVVVDHLNEVKNDNRPENLLISCNPCNRARGAILPFIERLRSESLEAFMEAVRLHHAHHHKP